MMLVSVASECVMVMIKMIMVMRLWMVMFRCWNDYCG